ncbi:MAG: inositol monophosphatase [Pontimonas sp.]|jgi:myo-inositol-1(or 4)-monophosphatase|nr:inositol monophosphatase [Pontimonas sp.]
MAHELHDVAVKLAREAGELIVTRRAGHIEVASTKSSDVDVVTAVDKESEEFLYTRLRELRPGDGFLGEEGQVEESTTGVTWVVDPIDGTVNFLYNIPHYAVSIAAVTGDPSPGSWQVEAGAVFNPATGELFHAARGEGAFLGERRLQIGSPPPMNLALLATGFAYSTAMRKEQVRILSQLIGEVRDIRRMGTASLDFAAVAAGRVDVYFERTLSPWDHAAGELLVTEAGGIIAGIRDLPQGREGIFAGHPTLVTQLKARISEVGGDTLLQDVPGWGLE